MSERKSIPFKTIGGKEIKYKIADLEALANEIVKERKEKGSSLLIQINPIKEKKYFDPNYHASLYRDPITGITFGIVVGFHPDGNPKFRKVLVGEFLTLNLERMEDAIVWAFLRWHPQIVGTPWEDSNPRYQIYDQDIEAEKTAKIADQMKKAINRASVIATSKLPWILRSLEINFSGIHNERILRSLLLDYAMSSPNEFLDFISTKNLDLLIVLRSAIDVGVIKKKTEGDYVYEGIEIGINESDALLYLNSNLNTLKRITDDLESRDETYKKIMTKKGKLDIEEDEDIE